MLKITAMVTFAAWLCSCATAPTGSLSASVTGAGDQLERVVTIDTRNYWIIPYQSEHFYRATIDKNTGTAEYQMYGQMRADQWIRWNEARYLDNTDLRVLPVMRVASDVSCHAAYGCIHYEDVLIQLDRAHLERWQQAPTTLRLSGAVAGVVESFLLDPAEISTLLQAVDLYL